MGIRIVGLHITSSYQKTEKNNRELYPIIFGRSLPKVRSGFARFRYSLHSFGTLRAFPIPNARNFTTFLVIQKKLPHGFVHS
jgi:hypothetical protein